MKYFAPSLGRMMTRHGFFPPIDCLRLCISVSSRREFVKGIDATWPSDVASCCISKVRNEMTFRGGHREQTQLDHECNETL